MQFHPKLTFVALFAVITFTLLLQIGIRVTTFVHIFGSHAGIALTQEDVLKSHENRTIDERPQVVPKIIHQIFHNWKDPGNKTLPGDWDQERQSCIELHPDWQYRIWNGADSRDFIAREYPWFLGTYDGYRFPVQRVDTLKYFLMLHYGGFYIDLDNGCSAKLDPLLYYPTFVTDGGHGALSNNIIGAAPAHPFWVLLTASVVPSSWNYPFPYMTISYATGQWFETAVWEEYHRQLAQKPIPPNVNGTQIRAAGGRDGVLHRVMMDMRPGAAPWVFFTQGRGGTWDNWDNHFFAWIGQHVGMVVLSGAAVVLGPCLCVWCCCRFRRRWRRGYARLETQPREAID